MPTMSLVVQKFGGTSVGDADRIRAVADHVAGFFDRNRGEVVFGQDCVEGADQVGGGVDQGAVEIEGDGPAGQIKFGQGRSPVVRDALRAPHHDDDSADLPLIVILRSGDSRVSKDAQTANAISPALS